MTTQSTHLRAAREALSGALAEYDRNICRHETTHRGGFLWTICDDCEAKWADDRGGFKPYSDPPRIVTARATLHQIDVALTEEAKAPIEPPPPPPSWLPAETFHAMAAAAQVAVHPPLAEWQANLVVMAVLAAMPPVQSEVTGTIIPPELAPALEPNRAMECLLETMRDDPGSISVYAAVGAVRWALDTIEKLRAAHFINVGRRG